jgi:predicted outer membrane protein
VILLLTESSRRLIAKAALALLALALAGCNGGTVDNHALKRDAEKVGSLATEGALLANDVSRGASTKSFARVHAQELSGAASDLEDSLAERPTSPGITAEVRRLSKLAGKVSRELEQLHLHPTDRSVAASLEQPLMDAADAADELAR